MTAFDIATIILCILWALSLALAFPPRKRPEWKGYHEIDSMTLFMLDREKRHK